MIIDSPKYLFCAIFFMIVAGCAQLPSRESIQPSYAIKADTPSTIGDAVGNVHPGLSGFYPLVDGVDAFVARLALIDSAEHTMMCSTFISQAANNNFIHRFFTQRLIAA